jgi:hypothetical protein
MANARSRYEALAAFLQQYKGAQIGRLYGMPCLLFDGEPFMMLHRESVAFRLNGRALTNALGLSGSTGFDPLHPDQPPPGRPGWVLVATAHFLSWDRLAVDAMRCASPGQATAGVVETAARAAPAATDAPAVHPQIPG